MVANAVVNFSGGAGSYVAAKRAIARYGADSTVLLFCDTKVEDPDLYRFLDDCEAFLDAKLVRIADGRDIWELFRDVRYLGNTRVAPCSTILKRELGDRWVNEHAPDSTRVFGIDLGEAHRAKRLVKQFGDRVWCPLLDKPHLTKDGQIEVIRADGIEPPVLYALGAPHNNCAGGCVKAGHAHFRWLYHARPCTYAQWERKEQELRDYLGKDIAILRDRKAGQPPAFVTLAEFRKRIEAKAPVLWDEEWGGCGCFLDEV